MAKNPIKPEHDKALRELAGKLPQPKAQGKEAKYGHEILEENPDAKDKHGRALDPKLKYTIDHGPAINHHRRLRKAFEAGGISAVQEYLKPYGKLTVQG